MNAAMVLAAFQLPAGALVNQRVPKKLLLEQAKLTPALKRQIQNGIEELTWLATLKPTTIGVPEYRDETREYLEIAVLGLELRPDARRDPLDLLIHRTIPYPVVLLTSQQTQPESDTGLQTGLSLTHKRASQAEAGATVLDGTLLSVTLAGGEPAGVSVELRQAFLESLALGSQPRANMHSLYQGWFERLEALLASAISGQYTTVATPAQAEDRRAALANHARLQREIQQLRTQAQRETQLNRRVQMNLTLQRLQAELASASQHL